MLINPLVSQRRNRAGKNAVRRREVSFRCYLEGKYRDGIRGGEGRDYSSMHHAHGMDSGQRPCA